jgi:hypothetical protein
MALSYRLPAQFAHYAKAVEDVLNLPVGAIAKSYVSDILDSIRLAYNMTVNKSAKRFPSNKLSL